MSALIIVDVQNDFCEGGSLAVPDGSQVIPFPKQQLTVLTCDYHPDNHISFASTHNKPPFSEITINDEPQMLWPDHCVQGQHGSQFHASLVKPEGATIIQKGLIQQQESYSGYGEGLEKTGLEDLLKSSQIQTVYVVGLAMEYCVRATAIGSHNRGFKTIVVEDGVRGIDQAGYQKAKQEMQQMGITVDTWTNINK